MQFEPLWGDDGVLDAGCWILDDWMLDDWMLDARYSILDTMDWRKAHGIRHKAHGIRRKANGIGYKGNYGKQRTG
jgi:hypothetical protein